MAYSAINLSHTPPGKKRETRITAGSTWASRGGNTIRRATFTWTADCTLILAKDASSAEASRIQELNLSAGSALRQAIVLEDYAGDLYVHTLTAKTLLHIEYA